MMLSLAGLICDLPTALDCEMVDAFFPGSSALTKLTGVVGAF